MTFPFDIPNYVQSFRFSDEADEYYNSTTKVFNDLAGYGVRNELEITTGTPAFVTESGMRGMTLDNTVQGEFIPSTPWEGSMIIVARHHMGINGIIYPVIFGNSATVTTNGVVRINRSSGGNYFYGLGQPGEVISNQSVLGNDVLSVTGHANDQGTRSSYGTDDGVTITVSTPLAEDDNGRKIAIAYHPAPNENAHKARFGNTDGVVGGTTVNALTCTIFEMHFFAGNIWTEHLTEAAAFMASLRTKYGVV